MPSLLEFINEQERQINVLNYCGFLSHLRACLRYIQQGYKPIVGCTIQYSRTRPTSSYQGEFQVLSSYVLRTKMRRTCVDCSIKCILISGSACREFDATSRNPSPIKLETTISDSWRHPEWLQNNTSRAAFQQLLIYRKN